MDWYGDHLILLPQYPDRFPSQFNGYLFSISKGEIANYLNSDNPKSLQHNKILFDSKDTEKKIDGFQGYEAIVFKDNSVYLSIEAEKNEQMIAYLIKGDINLKSNKITLDKTSLKQIPLPVQLKNMAIETLIIQNDRVIAIFEANGKNVNAKPQAVSFDLHLENMKILVFPNIEYRITDATQCENGQIWAINYLFKGDKNLLNPAKDELINSNVDQKTNYQFETIERLVKLEISDDEIEMGNQKPIQIAFASNSESRNWEGIVRYDSGFLIITDKFPRTILAFVPFPPAEERLTLYESNGKFGYKDNDNTEVIPAQFIFAQDFSEFGIAAVVDDSGWLFIDNKGNNLLRPHVIDNGPDYFSFGLARFVKNNKYGYFNKFGKITINAQYDYAKPFADSMAAVCQGCQIIKRDEHKEVMNGKWGFINLTGELVIPFIYDKVSDFNDGYAIVEKKGISITINRN